MKKWIWSILLLLALQQPVLAGDMLELEFPQDRAVLVVEEGSGQVLYTQNEEKAMYPASLTKLMTAQVVLDNNALEDIMVPGEEMDQISPKAAGPI
ncbi:hypothetical protein J0B03_00885 [Alkalibacter rhizosphaerae]|uniref:Peptidase S11 D-alanyl-D-alanine carboxypeptidase A N-terminal domain-containing protein n=1 Tax=Alkalibacter rhizosphaerae TaxID=2815577 RepID=A0A974XFC9_9FIRM|nr:hypothetical protein [Alkalibacter rhizosphaerae]QSX08676.1 hypothetical protein J0B03_00885 [Alkalibacter rhizosphaerae]